MLNFLSRPWILVGLLIANLAVGASFRPVMEAAGGALLDMQMNGADALDLLRSMTADQKAAHLRGTLLNDTAYPVTYGALLAGLLWRFGGSLRTYLVGLPIAGAALDLTENTIQVVALMGNEAFLGLKDVVTPLKFGLIMMSFLLVVVFMALGAIRKIRTQSN